MLGGVRPKCWKFFFLYFFCLDKNVVRSTVAQHAEGDIACHTVSHLAADARAAFLWGPRITQIPILGPDVRACPLVG